MPLSKAEIESVTKIREQLGKIKSSALMTAHAQSASDRQEHLRRVSDALKQAVALLDKLEKE